MNACIFLHFEEYTYAFGDYEIFFLLNNSQFGRGTTRHHSCVLINFSTLEGIRFFLSLTGILGLAPS